MSTDQAQHAERFRQLVGHDVSVLDREQTLLLLGEVSVLRGVLDHVECQLAGRLALVSSTSEIDHAQATRTSTAQATRSRERHRVAGFGPVGAGLAALLAEGMTSAAHLDRYTKVRSALNTDGQALLDDDLRIGEWAATLNSDRFSRRLRQLADSIKHHQGIDLLEQQQSAIRLRTRTDRSTGLHHISLTLDAERAFTLMADLDAAVQRLAQQPPPGCPDDPVERAAWLRAHAMLSLLEHGDQCRAGGYRRELVVVVDSTRSDVSGQPVVTWGHRVEPPLEALFRFAASTQHVTVIDLVRGATITTPSSLDLGRSARLASRQQRRALQALHPVCGVACCEVPFERCHIHHLTAWNDGGGTDLGNLVPLCSHHHHRAHEQGWELHLDDHRRLHITLPDGRTLMRAPPDAVAA
jgi:hypothetical protein